MEYTMEIAGLTRHLPLCPIGEDLYIGAFILFGDTPLTEAAAAALLKKAPPFDVLITAESKGIPLAYEMARQSGKPYVVARKGAKLYMRDILSVDVRSITTEKLQTLYIGGDEADRMRGKRVLLVDDVISTGASLSALETLVERVEGTIIGRMAVLAEGDAAKRNDILYLEELPLFRKDGTKL